MPSGLLHGVLPAPDRDDGATRDVITWTFYGANRTGHQSSPVAHDAVVVAPPPPPPRATAPARDVLRPDATSPAPTMTLDSRIAHEVELMKSRFTSDQWSKMNARAHAKLADAARHIALASSGAIVPTPLTERVKIKIPIVNREIYVDLPVPTLDQRDACDVCRFEFSPPVDTVADARPPPQERPPRREL